MDHFLRNVGYVQCGYTVIPQQQTSSHRHDFLKPAVAFSIGKSLFHQMKTIRGNSEMLKNLSTQLLCKQDAYHQWEFQDPKMEVLYHIRPYFLGSWNGHWYHNQSSLVQDVGLCSHEHFLCPCMFQVSVGLPSGRSEEFSIPQSSKVGDFQILAPKSCPVGFLRLVTAEGRQLVDPTESLQWCGVQNGDHLTAIVLEAKPQVEEAFAL